MIEVAAFKCEFCGKLFTQPGHATRHERHHCRSPKCRTCHTCAFSWKTAQGYGAGTDRGYKCMCERCPEFEKTATSEPRRRFCEYYRERNIDPTGHSCITCKHFSRGTYEDCCRKGMEGWANASGAETCPAWEQGEVPADE